jgi:hypothetical protein
MVFTRIQRMQRGEQIAAAVAQGKGIQEVASHFKVSPQTVRIYCTRHGVELTNLRTPGKTLRIIALLLNEPNLTIRDVSHRMGVTYQCVHQIYKAALEAGIPFSQTGRKGIRGRVRS